MCVDLLILNPMVETGISSHSLMTSVGILGFISCKIRQVSFKHSKGTKLQLKESQDAEFNA